MTTEPGSDPRPPRRWPRRILWLFGTLAILAVAVLAAIPWVLSATAGRDWLISRVNVALAPGSFSAESFSVSWFGPTRIAGLILLDERGDHVLEAPYALWDRSLVQFLFDRPRLGTLRLDEAKLDIQRDEEGLVDLYQTLRPVLSNDPRTRLRVIVKEGHLRFRTAELASPLIDDDLTMEITIAPKVSWRLEMTKPTRVVGGTAASLVIGGSFDRLQSLAGKLADLGVSIQGKQWPVALDSLELAGSGVFEGEIEARREASHWATRGDATLDALDLGGTRLSGDHLRLDGLKAGWEATESPEGWNLGRLDLSSPLGNLRGLGEFSTSAARPDAIEGRIEGTLDLAAIARQLPKALAIRPDVTIDQGTAALTIRSDLQDGSTRIEISAKVADLRARRGDRTYSQSQPATLGATVSRDTGGAYRLREFSAVTPFLQANASPTEEGGLALQGKFDLGAIPSELREVIDLGDLAMEGVGELNGSYQAHQKGYAGRLNAAVRGLSVQGLGPVDLRRDLAELTMDLTGPIRGSGFPAGWEEVRASWSSGTAAGKVLLVDSNGQIQATGTLPLTLGGRHSRLDVRLDALGEKNGLAIDRLALSLTPGPDEEPLAPLIVEAKGLYDREGGTILLEPIVASGSRPPVQLAPEGLRLAGIGQGGLRGDLSLLGDLEGLGRWVPEALRGLQGRWSAVVTALPVEEGLELGGRVELEGLALRYEDSTTSAGGPVSINLKALAPSDADRIDLTELWINTRYAALDAVGRIDSASVEPMLTLEGRLIPEWETVSEQVSLSVEPGASVRGRSHPFRLRAPLAGDWVKSAEGSVGLSLDGADIYGLKFGPTAIIARYHGQSDGIGVTLDPIDVEVNEGRLHLEPGVESVEQGGINLRLGKGSALSDVVINQEVSHRVLSFVAPVLDNATRVRGRFSVDLDDAVFPLLGDDDLQVVGKVEFLDVEFLPGSFLDPILGLINRNDRPLVRLDEPVSWSILDRRVYQRGLAVPVGKLTRIGLEGWVDFDRNLNLTASVPVVPTALTNAPLIGGVIGDASIKVPIRGTLDTPKVDGDVFAAGMKDLGKTVLERSVTKGAVQLLDRITRPRDPNAKPLFRFPSMEERKAKRLLKQAERKLKQEGEP